MLQNYEFYNFRIKSANFPSSFDYISYKADYQGVFTAKSTNGYLLATKGEHTRPFLQKNREKSSPMRRKR